MLLFLFGRLYSLMPFAYYAESKQFSTEIKCTKYFSRRDIACQRKEVETRTFANLSEMCELLWVSMGRLTTQQCEKYVLYKPNQVVSE